MMDSYRRASIGLYRTLHRQVRDIQRISSTTATTATALDLERLLPSIPAPNRWKGATTPQQLKLHLETVFRRGRISETCEYDGERLLQKQRESLSRAMEGVKYLDLLIQHLEQKKRKKNRIKKKRQQPPFIEGDSASEFQESVMATDEKTTQLSMKLADEWSQTMIDKVRRLPPIGISTDDKDKNATGDEEEGTTTYPLFPLTGPLYQPGKSLPMFSSWSYTESSLPGDSNVLLKIFEPRYRQLYHDLLLLPDDQRHVVVPLAHPYCANRFAAVGLLYRVTQIQEIADETQGVFQFLCRHDIDRQPVQLLQILDPEAATTRETYLRARGKLLPSWEEQEEPKCRDSVSAMVKEKCTAVPGFAKNAWHAWQVRGLWGFVRLWISCLQERLLQLELKLAAQLPHNNTQGDDDHNDTEHSLLQVQHSHRRAWLELQLESALTVPRLLQPPLTATNTTTTTTNTTTTTTAQTILTVLQELIQSEQGRKPFPRH